MLNFLVIIYGNGYTRIDAVDHATRKHIKLGQGDTLDMAILSMPDHWRATYARDGYTIAKVRKAGNTTLYTYTRGEA